MRGIFLYVLAGNTTCYVLEFILMYVFCACFSERKVARRRLICLILAASFLSGSLITALTALQIKESGFFNYTFLAAAFGLLANIIQTFVLSAAFRKLRSSFCFLGVTVISAASDLGNMLTESLEIYHKYIGMATSYWLKYLIRVPFLLIVSAFIYAVVFLLTRSGGITKVNAMKNHPGGCIFIGISMILLKMIILWVYSSMVVTFGDNFNENIYLILFLIIIVMIILLTYAYIARMKENEMKLMIGQQKAYLKRLEDIQRKQRAIQHDYKNVAAGLYLSAEAGDMKAVKQYINNQLLGIDEEIQSEIQQLNQLIQIGSIELKSLLLTKIAVAGGKNVSIQLEISGSPGDINLPTNDLLRCLGILLDNAIEGAECSMDKVVKVLIAKEKDSTTILVKNRTDDKVSLNQIFKPGYSTKGVGRGIGLYTLKELLRKHSNTLLETMLKDGWFIQIIKIR